MTRRIKISPGFKVMHARYIFMQLIKELFLYIFDLSKIINQKNKYENYHKKFLPLVQTIFHRN